MPESVSIHIFVPTSTFPKFLWELVSQSEFRRCRVWHHIHAGGQTVSVPFVDEEFRSPTEYELGPDSEELSFSFYIRCPVDQVIREFGDSDTFKKSRKTTTAAIGPLDLYLRSDAEFSRMAIVASVVEDFEILIESPEFNEALATIARKGNAKLAFLQTDDEFSSLPPLHFAEPTAEDFEDLENGESVDEFVRKL